MWPLSSFSQVVDTSRKTEEQKKDFLYELIEWNALRFKIGFFITHLHGPWYFPTSELKKKISSYFLQMTFFFLFLTAH